MKRNGRKNMNKSKQVAAPKTQPIRKKAFEKNNETVIRWLGSAGAHINSHGTNLMIDPMLNGFDMPLLIDMPIAPQDVLTLDAVLLTHCDNDHFSQPTCLALKDVCPVYHAPHYVASLCREIGLPGIGHGIGETFEVGPMTIRLTPADHAWQNESSKYSKIRTYQFDDYCGFWIDTPDGSIWVVGDSRLLEEQLHMEEPDVILFDFSDNGWHIGLDNAITLANVYPKADLILVHWGTVDAPEMDAFNGNPESLKGKIINEERIHVVAAGEAFILKNK